MSEFNSNRKRVPEDSPAKQGKREHAASSSSSSSSAAAAPLSEAELQFEDPFEDQYEQEEVDKDADDDDEDEESDNEDAMKERRGEMNRGDDLDEEGDERPVPKQTWRAGIDTLPEGEVLEYDPRAYSMYHSLQAEWPCLSFDVVHDNLGDNRQRYPLSMYLVIGSQADKAERNKLTLLRLSDLNKIHSSEKREEDDEDTDDDSDSDGEEEDPTLEHVNVTHPGGVNRVRSMPQAAGVVATMADTGRVHIFDLTSPAYNMMNRQSSSIGSAVGGVGAAPSGPVYSFNGHNTAPGTTPGSVVEGYGVDWSKVVPGRLATGDTNGNIIVWNVETGSAVANLTTPGVRYSAPKISCAIGGGAVAAPGGRYSGHRGSVEDLQWSPTEATVFCSASTDKSMRIWDVRGKGGPQISVEDAHLDDINVLSWNTRVSYLVATGCDDGSFKVWDLRNIKSSQPLAHFQYHKGPVTSIQWSYHDESLLAVSSSDDQVTIWDLSVEADDEQPGTSANGGAAGGSSTAGDMFAEYPPQLLFIHQGQHNVKELHFHPQIPDVLMTTAEDGFNVFKPAISVA